MKFFHLSDLHIGMRLYEHDLQEDQAYIFHRITQAAAQEQPDAIVIAGDIYDKAVPSAEAVTLFDNFITDLLETLPKTEILLISGNHDSASRIDLYRSVLAKHRLHVIGLPPQTEQDFIEKLTLRDEYGPVNFYLLPFVRPSSIRKVIGTRENGNNYSYNDALHLLIARENIDLTERNVLVSHQFYLPAGTDASSIERADTEHITVGNIDAVTSDVLSPFDYAALGHIHKPMKVGSDIWRYCGTPLPYSLSEKDQHKGLIVVEMGAKGSVSTRVLPLIPLRQVRQITGTPEEVLAQACDDFVQVILTGPADQDPVDTRERISRAFPYLLNIRRENNWTAAYDSAAQQMKHDLDPFTLCCAFLGGTDGPNALDDEDLEILKEVINTAKEVED